MRLRWTLLLCVGALLVAAALANSQAFDEDSLYPHLGNRGYDVQHYTIDLSWDDASNEISGVTTIEALATETLREFSLDLAGLRVAQLEVNNEAADFRREGRKLIVIPALPIEMDAAFKVTVDYIGIPEPDRNSGAGTPRGWVSTERGTYVVSEPSGGATWFPCNDHPTDKATYTLYVTVPEAYQVAASGLLQATTGTANSVTYHYEVGDLTATYLLTVNIGDYIEVTRTTATGLPIRSYFPNDATGRNLAERDDNLDAMIAYFSEAFGPYPFEAYGILVEPAFRNANEMQTLPIFNPGLVNERIMVHELAHQWFGNAVSPGDWSEIWLNEGFATYAEYLWAEHRYGPDVNSSLFSKGGYQSVKAMRPPIPPPAEQLFNVSGYHRGAWTLHALRLRVGDEAFFEILQTYFVQFDDRSARTDDFIAIAEAISDDDLHAFFQAWLYDPTPPPVPELGFE